jgi:hypothetical protein
MFLVDSSHEISKQILDACDYCNVSKYGHCTIQLSRYNNANEALIPEHNSQALQATAIALNHRDVMLLVLITSEIRTTVKCKDGID